MAKKPKKNTAPVYPFWHWRRWIGLAIKLGLVGIAFMVLFGIYLDSLIHSKFDTGQKWQLPAVVYSRPLELFPEQRLSLKQMLHELKLLNYRESPNPKGPGQYAVNGQRMVVIRRSFSFADGMEKARPLLLTFNGQRLVNIKSADNLHDLAYVRMDPVLLDRLSNDEMEDRILLHINQVPQSFINMLLLVEDRDFYTHGGVSLLSIGRAFLANLRAGHAVQGGSTLTQQLAKNYFLTRERSIWRKVQEAYMAVIIDYRYDKNQILETYMNEIYLGQNFAQGVYGFGLASYFYFGMPLNELEPDQMALLVTMVRGPSYYDPWRYPERAQQRRDMILRLMLDNNQLSPDQYQTYLARPLGLLERGQMTFGRTPAFMSLLRRELRQRFGDAFLKQSGLKIFTSLDPVAQQAAEEAVASQLDNIETRTKHKGLQGAMVVTNRHSGEVSALVGGRDANYAGLNRALDARRPIGSQVKPAVYLTALDQGFHLATPLKDEPLELRNQGGKVWAPQNYDRTFRGNVPLYAAMANSLNVPTVRLGMAVGIPAVAETLKKMGVTQEIPMFPSLFLGILELSPYEVNQAFLTLATEGLYQPLTAIRTILDSNDKVIYQRAEKAERRLDSQSAYLTLFTMTKVASVGTAKVLASQFPGVVLAGKTGTTDNLRDAWFTGMDNDELITTWVGRDDNQPAGLTGANGALPLFSDYMKRRGVNSLRLPVPQGISMVNFNIEGKPVAGGCGGAMMLPARTDKLPPAEACTTTPVDWLKHIFSSGE
ncbi:penicillin-binding protein 1B [Tolumonas lignilytica]|uniref:penicillin-binding protein 1B n=1 Tax=Tolumonas lignilytica TaxID=1283284 RepID=UPI0004667EE2|nr:penicillin-binding protein 1B [Tolumonas lignilytica]